MLFLLDPFCRKRQKMEIERKEGRGMMRRKRRKESGGKPGVQSNICSLYRNCFLFLDKGPLKLLLVLQGVLILLIIKPMNSTYFLFKRASDTYFWRIKHIKLGETVIWADYPEVGYYSSKDRLFPCYYLPS